jgi:hypothetical protein
VELVVAETMLNVFDERDEIRAGEHPTTVAETPTTATTYHPRQRGRVEVCRITLETPDGIACLPVPG